MGTPAVVKMSVPRPDTANVLLTYDLTARRAAGNSSSASAPFAALADGLARELEPLIHRELPIPLQKARLTRRGGRCPVHGTLLAFDPFAPHAHVCATCHTAYVGREHDDWWAMGAQLWTAERAVHAAALYAVRGDPRHEQLAIRILQEYAARYTSWPNTDNVLGPTRLFFSTYLESLWLLNVCHAVALLESASTAWTRRDADVMREQVIAPSATLIDSYYEGRSNRQVWNEVAILSAWQVLGETHRVRMRLRRPGGFCSLIENGLLDDGTWYEGENYHLFAHRGLWYGVQLMRAMQEGLPVSLDHKYTEGFVAPFFGVLPDDTFPSRRDSQYASSIRQWRTAEWCELGWAHSDDPRLAGILARIYDRRHVQASTGRATSTADAERNHPSTRLSRADLSWRALLMGREQLPVAEPWHPGSMYLPTQGLAILKRDCGQTYVALEGGQLGGGHGHPDQLALTLQTGDARWLQDPGTGSYTSPDLFWYRSTMAHAAPYVGHASQLHHAAVARAFSDCGNFGWINKRVDQLANGVRVERSVIVGDGYVIDVVDWQSASGDAVDFTLPIVGEADVVNEQAEPWRAVPDNAGSDVRSGPDAFFRETVERALHGTVELRAQAQFAYGSELGSARNDDPFGTARPVLHTARVWYTVSHPAVLRRSLVPGVPGQGPSQQHRLVCRATSGSIVGVWSLPQFGEACAPVSHVELRSTDPAAVRVDVRVRDGVMSHRHTRVAEGWRIDLAAIANGSECECECERERVVASSAPTHCAILLPFFAIDSRVTREAQQTAPMPLGTELQNEPTADASAGIPCVNNDALSTVPGSDIVGAHVVPLGRAHYVHTEQPWADAGSPAATVQLACTASDFIVDVYARTGKPVTSPLGSENPLDNERAAVNCDGLQWYMATVQSHAVSTPTTPSQDTPMGWVHAGIHVPANQLPSERGGYAEALVEATVMPNTAWRMMPDGWAMRLTWPRADLALNAKEEMRFELVVNECVADRERRRGQLVLSGGGGFGYLAGDRRPITSAVVVRLTACDE